LFQPQGLYGAWSARGLTAYAAGFAVSVPFFVIPNVYTGPLAARLSGVDIGWLVSAVAASGTYLLVSLRFDPADEAQASGPALPRELVDPT
jgi:purine-cytosine permease-like protein